MLCLKCKKEIPDGSKYCIRCGADTKTGKRRRSTLAKIESFIFWSVFSFLTFSIVIGILIAAFPGLYDYYRIYMRPEETRKGLETSAKIIVAASSEKEIGKTDEFKLIIKAENKNPGNVEIEQAKFMGLLNTQLLSSRPPFQRQTEGLEGIYAKFEPKLVLPANQTTSLTFYFKTTLTENQLAQVSLQNLKENIGAGTSFVIFGKK